MSKINCAGALCLKVWKVEALSLMKPLWTPGGWHLEKCVYWNVAVGLECVFTSSMHSFANQVVFKNPQSLWKWAFSLSNKVSFQRDLEISFMGHASSESYRELQYISFFGHYPIWQKMWSSVDKFWEPTRTWRDEKFASVICGLFGNSYMDAEPMLDILVKIFFSCSRKVEVHFRN